MRVAVIFFLFLCSHLLGGYNSAYANAHTFNISCLPADLAKTQALETADHTYQLTKDANKGKKDDYLIFVEDRDEDEEQGISKRFNLVTRYFSAFYHDFISPDVCCFFIDPLSFYRHPSYSGSSKYLEQRVLRI